MTIILAIIILSSKDVINSNSLKDLLDQNIKKESSKNYIRPLFIFYICYFPFIQALGLIFIKNTKDPLSNISKLDYLKLISINQVATQKYKEIGTE